MTYFGDGFAPAPGTYHGIDAVELSYTTAHDSGRCPRSRLRIVAPLIAAALYELGFAWEAGPLSTWSN